MTTKPPANDQPDTHTLWDDEPEPCTCLKRGVARLHCRKCKGTGIFVRPAQRFVFEKGIPKPTLADLKIGQTMEKSNFNTDDYRETLQEVWKVT